MDYEFNKLPIKKKTKKSKFQKFAIIILIFLLFVLIREVSLLKAQPPYEKPQAESLKSHEKTQVSNFSYTPNFEGNPAPEPEQEELEIIEEEIEKFAETGKNPIEEPTSEPQKQQNSSKNKTLEEPAVTNFTFFETNNSENKAPLDVGIKKIAHENDNLEIFVKSFSNLALEDELCLNLSSPREFAVACTNFTITPFEQKTISFKMPFSRSGIYMAKAYLTRADANSSNDFLEEKIKIPPIHDLGIENITYTQDTEKPNKITIKVRVLNYGDFNESGLGLKITRNNETRNYGPYSSEIKKSKTVTSTWTLNQTGKMKITAEITDYASFGEDAAQWNNIKTTYIHIG